MGKLDINLYLKKLRSRYQSSSRNFKKVLLDEFCQTTGFHRKHAIRLFNTRPSSKRRVETPGRKPKYDHKAVLKPLKDIWFAADQMCSSRLKSALPLWLEFYDTNS